MESSDATAPETDVWEIGLWPLLGAAGVVALLAIVALRLLGGSGPGGHPQPSALPPPIVPSAAVVNSAVGVARAFTIDENGFDWQAPDAGYAAAELLAVPSIARSMALFTGPANAQVVSSEVKAKLDTRFTPTTVTVQSQTPTSAVVTLAGTTGQGAAVRETVDLTRLNGLWKVSGFLSRYPGSHGA